MSKFSSMNYSPQFTQTVKDKSSYSYYSPTKLQTTFVNIKNARYQIPSSNPEEE